MESRSGPIRLVVFSDDWGRHPSSCQHLISQFLPRYPVLWVNTIGTRRPGFSLEDMGKVARKLREWTRPPVTGENLPDNLTVISPRMFPGFRSRWQRRFNARRISRAVNDVLGVRASGTLHNERRIAITTVPVTADLIGFPGALDVDMWVYYCVDDFSVWPGLDASVMRDMERYQVSAVDRVVAVSDALVDRAAALGRRATLLTHGIDIDHWTRTPDAALPDWTRGLPRPIFLFWGLIDRRLETIWCRTLGNGEGTLVLVGPTQNPDPTLATVKNIVMPGQVPYETLPALAKWADVLVMPYADLPVTRAMQPLKLKEYLATGKPTVVRRLPSTKPWSEACDVAETTDQFVEMARRRAAEGTPASQIEARRCLADETWEAKARQFEAMWFREVKAAE
ncbi:MAG: glycosyltransferase [Planctomycetes bacterium]|nr:glycosyltransferase [Planctomycetota bacterium]